MIEGFITLVYGDAYCRLPEHLYMTYKLFGNCNYPFVTIQHPIQSALIFEQNGDNKISQFEITN